MKKQSLVAAVGWLFVFLPAQVGRAQDVDVPGNLTMVQTADSSGGNVLKGGELFIHNCCQVGDMNTFIGFNAGNLTLTGTFNTASGGFALSNNTSGERNTAAGFDALQSNTIGIRNTAAGAFALLNNISGNANTATGHDALFVNSTGFSNTATGAEALFSNTSGQRNTAHGAESLLNNTTGVANTACGHSALRNNNTGSGNIACGVNALVFNTSGFGNTAVGPDTLLGNTTGNNNTAVGEHANVSGGNLTNATAIGSAAIVNASNKIRLGNASVTVIEGQVSYTFTSDKHQKVNFRAVDGEDVLRKIGGLSLTSWNYIGHDPRQFRHYGPVAQEFFGAFGHDGVGAIGTPTTINSGDIEGVLMIAVQALEKRTAENADLKARIASLEQLVKGIQAVSQSIK